jgi:toxin ParE1/3/4
MQPEVTAAATLSRRAQRELNSALRWIARDNPLAAQGLLDAVTRAAERIGRHPRIGTLRPDLTASANRCFVVLPGYPYLMAYNADRNPPRIVRIVHGARDLPRVLRGLR